MAEKPVKKITIRDGEDVYIIACPPSETENSGDDKVATEAYVQSALSALRLEIQRMLEN